jgi:nucleoside triphosphate pyrophosphatase
VAIVLASASAPRRALLTAAGVDVLVDPAHVDEAALKASLAAEGASPAGVAEALAELKATRVSARHGGKLVIGCDQILECQGQSFDKPADQTAARRQLQDLRGRRHSLFSAAVALRDGARLWHHVGRADLSMRQFSDSFLDSYLAAAGAAATGSVGAYQLEGLGAQLFERIEGDYFTILGLPLLPLLEFLRGQGEIAR